ncbi:unnamed protein product (macronuclear) [Paramecium tetraurelia]|uniref:Uncharacterized protein n=1 Tax=Paramecium tetraurelia TaxID=5888 RepID=A0EDZ6_PARTE|nr:uncharacterized protein GSPATT00025857001 [Paramecium tetraurelia]CAK93513.1 unnamed protein product [Paramecium tetraurelia]|eukprot:XP_001460910.1 hypothetical protein (macronuclear) [Paramecium tetraurelia strain d4-2]
MPLSAWSPEARALAKYLEVSDSLNLPKRKLSKQLQKQCKTKNCMDRKLKWKYQKELSQEERPQVAMLVMPTVALDPDHIEEEDLYRLTLTQAVVEDIIVVDDITKEDRFQNPLREVQVRVIEGEEDEQLDNISNNQNIIQPFQISTGSLLRNYIEFS